RAAAKAAQRDAVAPAASAPSLGGAAKPAAQPKAKPRAGSEDDFGDIEAILKKHGI
ncbi:membrane protein, partial [Streptomyces sp. AcH 505]